MPTVKPDPAEVARFVRAQSRLISQADVMRVQGLETGASTKSLFSDLAKMAPGMEAEGRRLETDAARYKFFKDSNPYYDIGGREANGLQQRANSLLGQASEFEATRNQFLNGLPDTETGRAFRGAYARGAGVDSLTRQKYTPPTPDQDITLPQAKASTAQTPKPEPVRPNVTTKPGANQSVVTEAEFPGMTREQITRTLSDHKLNPAHYKISDGVASTTQTPGDPWLASRKTDANALKTIAAKPDAAPAPTSQNPNIRNYSGGHASMDDSTAPPMDYKRAAKDRAANNYYANQPRTAPVTETATANAAKPTNISASSVSSEASTSAASVKPSVSPATSTVQNAASAAESAEGAAVARTSALGKAASVAGKSLGVAAIGAGIAIPLYEASNEKEHFKAQGDAYRYTIADTRGNYRATAAAVSGASGFAAGTLAAPGWGTAAGAVVGVTTGLAGDKIANSLAEKAIRNDPEKALEAAKLQAQFDQQTNLPKVAAMAKSAEATISESTLKQLADTEKLHKANGTEAALTKFEKAEKFITNEYINGETSEQKLPKNVATEQKSVAPVLNNAPVSPLSNEQSAKMAQLNTDAKEMKKFFAERPVPLDDKAAQANRQTMNQQLDATIARTEPAAKAYNIDHRIAATSASVDTVKINKLHDDFAQTKMEELNGNGRVTDIIQTQKTQGELTKNIFDASTARDAKILEAEKARNPKPDVVDSPAAQAKTEEKNPALAALEKARENGLVANMPKGTTTDGKEYVSGVPDMANKPSIAADNARQASSPNLA